MLSILLQIEYSFMLQNVSSSVWWLSHTKPKLKSKETRIQNENDEFGRKKNEFQQWTIWAKYQLLVKFQVKQKLVKVIVSVL